MSAFIPILRGGFLYLSQQPRLRRWMETSPAANRVTKRFIAGLTLDDGLRIAHDLKTQGMLATLDYLGENVKSLEEAAAARDAYCTALDQIAACGLAATVSLKLTALGLDLSEEACFANAAALVERAVATGSCIEFDMEASSYTDRTLRILTALHDRQGGVRAVIQAYLHRSADDVDMLCRKGIPVRLCKGAYQEPPQLAYPKKADVDANYWKLLKVLLDRGTYPAIASHDEKILEEALRYVRERKIPADRLEFQMLYGIRRGLQRRIVEQGFRLRLYVPYGTAWYPYFMRRLAERPANILFLVKNLFHE
ncbi:MAG TPA: proline dehydrogenase family protein [Bryobacteraceae bacterium]|nr:proline dehydrogenase family protein [Bryobacteraceae bacterium]